jgi:hypothetical protein
MLRSQKKQVLLRRIGCFRLMFVSGRIDKKPGESRKGFEERTKADVG